MTGPAKIITVTLNPAIDQTVNIPGFRAGEVNRVTASRLDAGGKGINVASFLADLGVPVLATGFLGDENAEIFERLFRSKAITDSFLRLPGSTRVGVKIVDSESHQTTDINFPGLTPGSGEIRQLLSQVQSWAEPGSWFVLSGSIPSGLSPEIYSQLIEEIRGRGGRVALDTSGEPLQRAMALAPDVVKPNLAELEELTGRKLNGVLDVRDAARSLVKTGVGLVVVSMGAEGAVFVNKETALLARPPQVQVKSSVGAGDAMVSGIVYAQVQELELPATARLATALGAYAVTRFGAGLDLAQVHQYEKQVQVEVLRGNELPDQTERKGESSWQGSSQS
jgi:1-phosphofructokinase